MRRSPPIVIDSSWEDFAADVRRHRGTRIVYAVGAANRGKTTFCRYLARELSRDAPAAYVDCDPGQSSIGPPATIGMQELGPSGSAGGRPLLYFIGSTSPKGHLLPCLSGAKRLTEEACARGARTVILDSSGYVLNRAAREFQFHVIDLVQPDFLAAFQAEGELEDLLRNFTVHPRTAIYRMPVSPAVETRTVGQRQRYRHRLFRAYFRGASIQDLDIRGMGVHGVMPETPSPDYFDGLLAAVCDRGHFVVVVGVVASFRQEEDMLSLFAPPFDRSAAASVHFGSFSLDLNG